MHSHNLRINPWKIYRNGRQFVEATMLPLHLEYSGWECQIGRRRETVGARGASQQNLISVWPSDSRYKGSFTYFYHLRKGPPLQKSKSAKRQSNNKILSSPLSSSLTYCTKVGALWYTTTCIKNAHFFPDIVAIICCQYIRHASLTISRWLTKATN